MSTKRDRVILPLLLPEKSTEDQLVFDLPSLFLHLLLFERVILRTTRLGEIVALVRAVGFKQTMQLLESGCLYLRSPLDQLATPNSTPPNVCQILYLWGSDPEQTLSFYFRELSKLGLRRSDRDTLKREIVKRWLASGRAEPYVLDAIRNAEREALDRSPTFMAALNLKLAQAGLAAITADQISAERLDNVSELRFRIAGVDTWTPGLTKAVRAATVSVAELGAQFGHMDRDNAVGGFKDDSLAIMEQKVESLWRELRPNERVEQFYRVQTLAEMPNFDESLHDPGLDMKAFLKARETNECREFREFLSKCSSFTDEEVKARTISFRATLGDKVKSVSGKILRLVGTTGAGLAFGASPPLALAAGVTASVVDSFLVEKVFASKGIISFIGSQYPSIFN